MCNANETQMAVLSIILILQEVDSSLFISHSVSHLQKYYAADIWNCCIILDIASVGFFSIQTRYCAPFTNAYHVQ